MGAFEDFIQDELPLRQVVVKADGNPSTGDGYIAAVGTYYLDTADGFKRYEKFDSGNTDWRVVPTSTSSGALETSTVLFDNDSEISTIKITNFTSTQLVDSFNVSEFQSAKYILRASDSTQSHCSELLLLVNGDRVEVTEYGVLGDSSLISYTADVSNGVVGLSGDTSETLTVSVYKFLLS